MKSLFAILLGLVMLTFSAALGFAVNFAPAVMKISAPKTVSYQFDGSDLAIPATISGTGGTFVFLVFTKDQAAKIGKIRNGFLGWHTVNHIDTCVYMSGPVTFNLTGTNTIHWNGKGEGGSTVPPGDYTYYIWGFDSLHNRYIASNVILIVPWSRVWIITHTEKGIPLANPIIHAPVWQTVETEEKPHLNRKWAMGGDPYDESLLETCSTIERDENGGLYFHPEDYRYFFKCSLYTGLKKVKKWQWVPNGAAVLQTGWGKDGIYSYNGSWPAKWGYGTQVLGDGKDQLFLVNADNSGGGTVSELIYVDINDGTEVRRLDLAEWWVNMDEKAKKGQGCGGPVDMNYKNGLLSFNSFGSCMHMMINPEEIDPGASVVWINQNGDYVGDKSYAPDAQFPWVCHTWNFLPHSYNHSLDSNMFSNHTAVGIGASTFVFAPDGTGMGIFTFADQTATSNDYGINVIDYDSAYDGYYTSFFKNVAGQEVPNVRAWYYVAHDSFKGTITKAMAVGESAPEAFSVAQNSPNPFNPTTTISFTTAEAGKVTVSIFNVAGQNVDTLMDGFIQSGTHSVVWNASKFSAGVYFYTVKSGSLAKTMKMTLMK